MNIIKLNLKKRVFPIKALVKNEYLANHNCEDREG